MSLPNIGFKGIKKKRFALDENNEPIDIHVHCMDD